MLSNSWLADIQRAPPQKIILRVVRGGVHIFRPPGARLANAHTSEHAKGAEKALCGEMVVQKSVFGESISFPAPLRIALQNT